MHIAETKEQAYKDVEYGIEQWFHYFQKVAAFPQMAVEGGDIKEMIDFVNDAGIGAIGTGRGRRGAGRRSWSTSPAASARCCCWPTSGPTRRRRGGPSS